MKSSLKKTKKLSICFAAGVLLALSGMTAMASTYPYSRSLPPFQGHTTLITGAYKSKSSSIYAEHFISELGNDNAFAYCWVDNTTSGGRNQATLTTRTNVRQATGMRYTNGSNWSGSVELRAYASNWGPTSTLIKGSCDFDRP